MLTSEERQRTYSLLYRREVMGEKFTKEQNKHLDEMWLLALKDDYDRWDKNKFPTFNEKAVAYMKARDIMQLNLG